MTSAMTTSQSPGITALCSGTPRILAAAIYTFPNLAVSGLGKPLVSPLKQQQYENCLLAFAQMPDGWICP